MVCPDGQKTWAPRKNLKNLIALEFGIPVREQIPMIEIICEAITNTAPHAHQTIRQHAGFRDLGKYMLLAWDEGIQTLRDKRHYFVCQPQNENILEGIDPPKLANPKTIIDQSEGLGSRRSHSKNKKDDPPLNRGRTRSSL